MRATGDEAGDDDGDAAAGSGDVGDDSGGDDDGDGGEGETRGDDDGDGGGETSGGSVATTGGGEASSGGVATTGGGGRAAPHEADGGEARRGIRIVIRHDDGSRSRLRAGLDSGALGDSSAAWSGFPYRSGRDATNFDMGYSRSEFFVDLCVNVLVRPTRISPRQSGAAGPCSTLRGCTARPDRRLRTAVSSAGDRAERRVP